jgi:hypothetical protein
LSNLNNQYEDYIQIHIYITSKSNFAGVFAIRGIVESVADFVIEKERGDKVTEV